MKGARRLVVVVAWLCLLVPGVVRAKEADPLDEPHRFPPIWLTAQGGGMFPAGQQGAGLTKGYQFLGTLSYEVGPSFALGGDLGWVQSDDDFQTRIVLMGMHGRLYPSMDLHHLYVECGAGLYSVTYQPIASTGQKPPDKVRPGLSFSVGNDFFDVGNVTFGILGGYHGIMLARSDALSYMVLGVYASLRPSYW